MYRLNSVSHSAVVWGGRSPVNFQSVMERPDRVRRVMPPRATILNTQALPPASHTVNARRIPGVRPAVKAAPAVEIIEEDADDDFAAVVAAAATVLRPRRR